MSNSEEGSDEDYDPAFVSGEDTGRHTTVSVTDKAHCKGSTRLVCTNEGESLSKVTNGVTKSSCLMQSVSLRIPLSEGSQATAQAVALSPDGEMLVVGTSRGAIGMWAIGEGQTRAPLRIMQPFPNRLEGYYQPISSLTFAPNGQYFVSTQEGDQFLTVSRGGKCGSLSTAGQKSFLDPLKCNGHKAPVTCSSFLVNNSTNIITGSIDSTARLWSAERVSDGPISTVRHGKGLIGEYPAVYSVMGVSQTCYVTAGRDNYVQMWDVRKPYRPGNTTLQFELPVGETVGGLCVSGHTIIARCHSGHVYELRIRKEGKAQLLTGNSIVASGVAAVGGDSQLPIAYRSCPSQIWTGSSYEGYQFPHESRRTIGGYIGACCAEAPYNAVSSLMCVESEGSVLSISTCLSGVAVGTTRSIQVFSEPETDSSIDRWMKSIDNQIAYKKARTEI